MKRILSFLSLMILSLFTIVACSKSDNTLAQDLVDSIILEQEGSAVEGDFGLISELSREGKTYPLKWKSNSKYVKIADKADAGTLSYRATVNRNVPEEQAVTLTATAEADGGKASRNFEVLVLPYELYDFIEAYSFPLDGANLYGEYTLDKEFTLPNAPESAKISWSTECPLITIDNNTCKMNVALKFVKVETVLKATWTYKGETATKNYTVNVLQQTLYEPESNIEENTPYVFGLLQKNLENSYLWMNGKISDGKRGATTKNLAEAKEFYLEKAAGGFHIYFKEGNTKKYMNSTKDRVLSFDAQAAENCVWAWDANGNTVLAKVEGETYFLGTYNKFDTISVSTMDHFKGNFIAQFFKKSTIESSTPTFPAKDAVQAELELATIEDVKSGEYILREQGRRVETVDFTYALKEGAKNVKLEGNKLIVNKIYDNEESFVVVITAQSGDAKASKEVTVKHLTSVRDTVHYGPATELDVNTTYKLAMHQGNTNKTVYFTGAMDGYYGASSEVAAEGVNVTLVAVEGGYNLKFVDAKGATKYINATLSSDGQHKNFTLGDKAVSVWTWDATNKTITTKLGDANVFIGTRNDKNYSSFGLVTDPASAFVANLYCEVKPHNIQNPAVGAEYQLVMNHGGKQYFFNGKMDKFYGDTTLEKAEAAVVVLEEATGGFYVSFTVEGAKKYINLTKSSDGQHTNMLLEAEPKSVWTWDAANKTITTKLGEEVFVLGTKKSGTYTTISVAPISKAADNDLVGFFGFVEGTVPQPEPEPVVPQEMTIAEAKASAKDTAVILTGKVVAVENEQFIIQDNSGLIVINAFGTEFTTMPALGDSVKVTGTHGVRNGADQIVLSAAFEKVTDLAVTEPTAVNKTPAEIKEYKDQKSHNPENVIVEGKLVIDSKYINIYFTGVNGYSMSIQVSDAVKDTIKNLNNRMVRATGYIYAVSGFGEMVYVNMILASAEDITTDADLISFEEEALLKLLPDPTRVLNVNGEYFLKPSNTNIKFEVTVTGTAFVYNAETSTLSVTPANEEATNTLKIVYTLNTTNKTFEYTLKTKLDNTPKDVFVMSDFTGKATKIENADPKLAGYEYVSGDAKLVNLKAEGVNDPINTKAELRVYGGHTVTISSTKTITKIVFESSSAKYSINAFTPSVGNVTVEGLLTTWTGSATSVVFTNTGAQARAITVTVYYEA